MRLRKSLLLALLLLAAVGCRKEGQPTTESPDRQQMPDRLAIAMREVTSIDPAFLNSSNDFQVAANIYEALYRYNAVQGRAEPALIAAQRSDDENRIWFFKLKPGIKYADGTPIKAADFVFAWRRILDPATASPGADALFVLRHGRAIAAGEDKPFPVTVLGPDELRVELESPQPFLPEILASPRFAPLPEAALADPTKDFQTLGFDFAGGPYRVTEWKPRESMRLEPNPHYQFPTDATSFAEVALRFTSSEETALTWWDGRRVDLVQGLVPFQKTLFLKGKYPGALVSRPMHSVFYLLISDKAPALADVAVRRALFSALDREGLATDVLGGGQAPALAFVPPTYATATGFDPHPCRTSDDHASRTAIEAARGALAGAEMACNASETLRTIMEFLQQSLKTRLDLFLAIRMVEWGSYLEMLKQQDFLLARMSFSGGPDPLDFLESFTSDSSNNFGGFKNDEYDQIVAAIRNAGDVEERADMMQKAHATLCHELPAIPVYFSTQVYLVREPLRDGFKPSPEGIIYYQSLR